ncbi:guanylate kinase [Geosporobacter ferrireducens]|uniref:Guanylate kinase n=1 Tax=Geosporobacter ferrireducens TaxID=1424294 RepID=A0A1D8GBY3_9FIRM|nr:guanylate kinase [Geosporobacter ferrireducens]AOT68421.1 guanylate kinase [Geosporobacter ferrireducens]MTI53876.1 guanylate kinase [Geosporobacter ferrireducens]
MMNKGLLIVVSGPSGAGKGSICRQLLNTVSEIKLSVSVTTRNPRSGEVEGENYYFVEKKDFEKLIEKDDLLEYAKVYDNYYGTPRKYVMDHIQQGKDVLLEIDIQGALQIKERYPEGIFVFILPPSMQELKRRIIHRGSETEASLEKRFQSAFEEINYVKKYDYCVVNDHLDQAVERVKAIIKAEKCKVTKDIEEIILKYKEEGLC